MPTSTPAEPGFSRTLTTSAENPFRLGTLITVPPNNDNEISLFKMFRQLEHLMAKEIRSYWDTHFLSDYILMAQIPRGLWIKKFPTSKLFNDDFKKEWTDTLSSCSFNLMGVLIKSNQKQIEKLQTEVSIIQKELTSLQTHPDFMELDGKLNKKLDKLEKYVIDTKKGKKTRDCIDYESNSVYVWRQPQYQSKRPPKNRIKKVSFSDLENEVAYDTMATSGSESSPDRGTTPSGSSMNEGIQSIGHPHGSNKEAKRKITITRKQVEGGKDTRTKRTPYALRGGTQK